MKHTEKIAKFKILLYLVFAIISLINIVKAQGLIEIDLHGVDLKKESLETNFGINKLRDILGLSKDYEFECLNDSNISNYDFYGEHIFYLQYYKGIKIDGAILGVHLKQRNTNSIEGHYLKMDNMIL